MRWRILALLFAARIGLGVQFQALTSVGDDLVVAFRLTRAEIGTLIGLFMAPGLFLALPAGLAGRHLSDRTLAVLGLGALAAGGLVSATAGDGWTVGLGRVLAGAGFLVSTLYFAKMLTDWFSGGEIATAMSVLVMSWPFGIAMGQVGHEWLAGLLGWRAPFYAASAYCVIGALAILALYRPAPGARTSPGGAGFDLTRSEWGLVLAAGIAWGMFNAGYVGYLTHAPLMLEADGHTGLQAAAIISIGSWLMILSGTVCGQIVDRTGRRGIVLAVCMAGAVVALLLLRVEGAGAAASILFGLVGMAPAGVIMALAAEAVRRPERRAMGMGVFFMVYYAIMAASPPIAGRLLDATGSPGPAIVFAAALFLAVLPAAAAFRLIGAPRCASPALRTD